MCRFILLSALLLIGVGCSVSDDPSEGGFVGGVYGITSGAYDRRLEEREENLTTLRRTRQATEQEQVTLQAKKQDLAIQRNALQAQSDELMQTINALSANIQQLNANTHQLRQQKRMLNNRQQSLQRELTTLQANVVRADDSTAITQYKVEEQRLRQEIQALEESLFLTDLE